MARIPKKGSRHPWSFFACLLLIHYINRLSFPEGLDVVRSGLHDALARLLGRPGDMWRDDAVLRGEKNIVRLDGLSDNQDTG